LPPRGRSVVRCPGEVEEVGSFGLVELQGASDGFEDAVGDPGEVPAFEPGVVVDADAREHGDFFASEAGNAAGAVVTGEPDVLGCDAGAPGREELVHVGLVVHDRDAMPIRGLLRGSVITWYSVTFSPRVIEGSMVT
jgi:hypothetical protein